MIVNGKLVKKKQQLNSKPRYELDKENSIARTKLINTREKTARLQLARAREDLIEKQIVQKQAAYIFIAIRQKMLAAPLTYHRRFMHIEDPHVALHRLEDIMHTMLREFKDFPKKVVDPNWMDSIDDE